MTTLALKISTRNAATIRTANAARPARHASPGRAFPWDLAGVLTLLGTSAAYALFTLTHLA